MIEPRFGPSPRVATARPPPTQPPQRHPCGTRVKIPVTHGAVVTSARWTHLHRVWRTDRLQPATSAFTTPSSLASGGPDPQGGHLCLTLLHGREVSRLPCEKCSLKLSIRMSGSSSQPARRVSLRGTSGGSFCALPLPGPARNTPEMNGIAWRARVEFQTSSSGPVQQGCYDRASFLVAGGEVQAASSFFEGGWWQDISTVYT